MIRRGDPLDRPEELIRRVYAYVAYRLGNGADAEDVTSETFERALRYRSSYDAARGEPIAWLIGIARHCIRDLATAPTAEVGEVGDPEAPGEELETTVMRRVELASALARLGSQDRDLLALRYGADLSARRIAQALEMRTNAVEVALHRARKRLRVELEQPSNSPSEAADRRAEAL